MNTTTRELTPRAAAEALSWLAEMGADEVIAEVPVNRIGTAAAVEPPSRRKPGLTAAAKPVQVTIPRPAMEPSLRLENSGGEVDRCQNLAELQAALEAYDACALKKTATKLCFADGNPNARVMLIGEAPERDEDEQGLPFVGRSGQLLDRMLAAIGLSRAATAREDSVFMINAVFWRPPGNRKPTDAETTLCLPFLRRAIELQQPDMIVCLGVTAAHRLAGKSGSILKLRGKWLEAHVGGLRIPMLPTLHPTHLLKQPAQKRLAWRDLLLFRKALDAH